LNYLARELSRNGQQPEPRSDTNRRARIRNKKGGKKVAGLISDDLHAGVNFVAGAIFRKSNTRGSNAAYALGAAVLLNALCTDYPLGVFRLWTFRVHGMLDYGVAATSAALPPLLRIHHTAEAKYFYSQGGGETVIAGITDYNDDSGARRIGAIDIRDFPERRTA
jgi:hypothetical protein